MVASRFPVLWRALIAAGAVVVLSAAGIAAGLLLGTDDTGAQAAETDRFAAAPGCDAAGGAVESVAPGAVLESDEPGPLEGGSARACAWTSVDADRAAPRTLQVDFHAYFTAEEAAGADTAAAHVEALRSAEAVPVPELGADAVARTGPDGTSEIAFHRENLVVHVWYGGADDSGDPLDPDAAHSGATEVAEAVALGL